MPFATLTFDPAYSRWVSYFILCHPQGAPRQMKDQTPYVNVLAQKHQHHTHTAGLSLWPNHSIRSPQFQGLIKRKL